MRTHLFFCTAALASLPLSAAAFNLTLGVRTGITPAHEGAKEVTVSVAPVIRPSFRTPAPTLAGRVHHQWGRTFQAGPSFGVIGARDANSPNSTIAKLRPVDTALELGAYIGTGTVLPDAGGALAARVAVRHDVLGGHGGFQIEPSIHAARAFNDQWAGTLSFGAAYASEKYVDSYFDITAANQGTSGLALYDAEAGFKDLSFKAGISYDFTPSWSLGLETEYKRLIGSVADSPVVSAVGTPNQLSSALTLSWRWEP